MKTEGKPRKEIKEVWEETIGKKTGKSTLSVRYCTMKENFGECGGQNVSVSFCFRRLGPCIWRPPVLIMCFLGPPSSHVQIVKQVWGRIATKTATDCLTIMTVTEARNRYKTIKEQRFRNGSGSDEEGSGGDESGLQGVTDADRMTALDLELNAST